MIQKEAVALEEADRDGNLEDLEDFVRHHQDRLYNVVYRMSFDESETLDVLQETFLKAIRNLGSFRGESQIGTWLHRIAVNTYLQLKSKKQPELLEDLSMEELKFSRAEAAGVRPPTPDEAYEQKEGQRVLEIAIGKLPKEYRAVLVLRDQEGHSSAETAEILGISVPAVKARLHRARLFVRRELERLAPSDYEEKRFCSETAAGGRSV